MKKLILTSAFLCAFVFTAVAGDSVNVVAPTIGLPDGSRAVQVHSVKADGTENIGGAGGGGSGTSDATAANQTTQIAAEQAIRDRLPATVGQKASASSVSVVLSNDGPFTTNFGAAADTAATSDTGTFSSMALTKRLLQSLTTISTNTGSNATAANQATANTSLSTIATNTTPNVGSATTVSSTVAEASHVLKASAGTLIGIIGYNNKTSDQFIEVFNSTTVPADGTVPILTFIARASSNFSVDMPITGIAFSTGISISNSSTFATKTVAAGDCFFTAIVK